MRKGLTYKSSGVDIQQANNFVKGIQPFVQKTMGTAVLKGLKAFASCYALDIKKYKKPVLVSSTDGVGTKLLIAKSLGIHDSVGIDLVAMNVNDILCVGAQPLFFLDYIACGRLRVSTLNAVVRGIAEGCCQAGCSLIGGETAEMPGMYRGEDYDLAGFAVGVVDRDKMITGSRMKAGDVVIGLPSSGLHSNGFSLVRKVFSDREQRKMSKELLEPTRIYVKDILPLLAKYSPHGMAHITGGAYYEKLTKVLPAGLSFEICKSSWPVPEIFKIIQRQGHVPEPEMYRTFNMGIGLALIVAREDAPGVRAFLRGRKIVSYEIGQVTRHREKLILTP